MKDKVEILKAVPLFKGLSRVELARLLPEIEEVEYKNEDMIFRRGEYGDALLIIVEGQVRVFLQEGEDETNLAVLGEHECIGEMALLTGAPRSANVQALTRLSAFRITRECFENMIGKHHFLAVHLTKVLSERIARNDEGSALQWSKITNLIEAKPEILKESLWTRLCKIDWADFMSTIGWKYILVFVLWAMSIGILQQTNLSKNHTVLTGLLFLAALVWGFNLMPFNLVALSLPVLAVLFQTSDVPTAFSGFSSNAWFLILGVLAITAALTNTGLLYRCIIWMVHRFSPNYENHTLALTLSGLLLTPVIPSADARTVLASTIATDLLETLGYRSYSPEAVGLSMACMLGFGQLSFIFMNGNTSCLLAYGLLPSNVASAVNWGTWLAAALPMGLVYAILSWWTIIRVHKTKDIVHFDKDITGSQLAVLGLMTREEKISLFVIIMSLLVMASQPLHHLNNTLVALTTVIILASTAVLSENSMRRDIDWNKLLAIGALIGFGTLIKQSGLPAVWANTIGPLISSFSDNPYIFLVLVALFMILLRFALPLIPALVVAMLMVIPAASTSSISPFVIMIVILAASNPWFLPYQSTVYQSLVTGTENRLFKHQQTLTLAYLQVLIICLAILVSIPYWHFLQLL